MQSRKTVSYKETDQKCPLDGFFVSVSANKVPVMDFSVYAFFGDSVFEFSPVAFKFFAELFVT